jgi:hypothetical protein
VAVSRLRDAEKGAGTTVGQHAWGCAHPLAQTASVEDGPPTGTWQLRVCDACAAHCERASDEARRLEASES